MKGRDLIGVAVDVLLPALEAGVRSMLESDPDIRVTSPGHLGAGSAHEGAVDVRILTSAALADWSQAPGRPRSESAVLVLGGTISDVKHLRASGVTWGTVPIDASAQELRAAVHAVSAGLIVCPPHIFSGMDSSSVAADGPLSEREVEVLEGLLRGLANKQIAAQLAISEHTVKFHVSSIYAKLGVSNRTEAVREGLRNGLITL